MKVKNKIFLRVISIVYFFLFSVNLMAQTPKISAVERESKDFLATKILLYQNNLTTNFIRLNDEIEFVFVPTETKLYTYNLQILGKKGIGSIKILNYKNLIVDFVSINEIKKLNVTFSKQFEANKSYRIILKGEQFKGKINLIWL